MGDVWPQLLLVVVLVLVNAAFAGTELALVSLRESQLQRLEEGSATGGVLARLARQPNQFLATIQIGITLAGFLASAAAAVSLAEPLEAHLGFLGGAAGPVSVIIVTLVLAYFTLVFGELAPKRIAMQRAEKWGMVMARPLDLLVDVDQTDRVAALEVHRPRGSAARRRPDPPTRGSQRRGAARHGRDP